MDQTVVSRIVGRLYEGAASPQEWSEALNHIRIATGGALFYNFAVDTRSMSVVASLQNLEVPADKVREYEQHHAASDERMPIVMGLPVGQPMFDHEHFTSRELSRSFIYSDWLPSLGYRHTFSVPLRDEDGTREFLSIMLPSDAGPFKAADRELIERLMPDLMRASRLRARMSHVAARAVLGLAALDSLPHGVAVLDASCRVVHLNPAAERTLRSAHGLVIRNARLQASDSVAQEELAALVATACGRGQGAPAGVFRCRAGALPDLVVRVLPLNALHPVAAAHAMAPHAILVWQAPLLKTHLSALSPVLGLTDAETRLALMLAQGQSVRDFALAQGCSWHTARTHATNLLRKTGCHRQAELVQLVHSLMGQ